MSEAWGNYCPVCSAKPYQSCMTVKGKNLGKKTDTHSQRMLSQHRPPPPPLVTDWTTPTVVSNLDIAFGAGALDLMPPWEECEAALKAMDPALEKKWRNFQRTWFYEGLKPSAEVNLVDGIDGDLAFRHLKVIQGSFAPKHEHKEAAVAYLASLWFTDVRL